MAKANPFRFSTKYQDDETDLLYYGKRYFSASTGRWINKDPIGESGGRNLYAFLQNDGVTRFDVLGMGDFRWVFDITDIYAFPADENHPNPSGETTWAHFSPEAEVFSKSSCCYGVRLSGGKAEPMIEYIPGTLFDEDVLTHELNHVNRHFRPAYDDYKAAAAKLGAPCMSKTRAECLRNVIVTPLKEQYSLKAYYDGLQYDWLDYGWKLGGGVIWRLLEKITILYGDAEDATTAAVSACSSKE